MRRPQAFAALAALVAAGCTRNSDPASAAKVFFEQLAAGETHATYRNSAFAFQAAQSEQEFAANARDWGLIGAASVNVGAARIDHGTARISVGIGERHGPALRLIASLHQETGAWRIRSVKTPVNLQTGLASNPFTRIGSTKSLDGAMAQPIPDVQRIREMTRETLLQFHDAIHQKSFEEFYRNVSRAWQEELTLGMLTRTFQGFIDQQPDLSGIRNEAAILDPPPRIDSDGLLIVSGSYPTKPLRVVFSLKYYYGLPDWRVFGLNVNLYK